MQKQELPGSTCGARAREQYLEISTCLNRISSFPLFPCISLQLLSQHNRSGVDKKRNLSKCAYELLLMGATQLQLE